MGATPNEKTLPFDDEIIKAAADHLAATNETGVLLKTARSQSDRMNRVSDDTRANLRLLATLVKGESIPDDEYFGGGIRETQAELADGAIVIGGSIGVKHTASLFMDSWPPKPVDEIFVKGLAGGLPPDRRARIDESREWDSKADSRTVHEGKDCERVACAVATDIALRLRKRESVAPEENDEQKSSGSKSHGLGTASQVASLVNTGINAAKFLENE